MECSASSTYRNHNTGIMEKCLNKDLRNRHAIALLPGWAETFILSVKPVLSPLTSVHQNLQYMPIRNQPLLIFLSLRLASSICSQFLLSSKLLQQKRTPNPMQHSSKQKVTTNAFRLGTMISTEIINATFVDDTPHAEIASNIELMLLASVQALLMLLLESAYRPEYLSRDKLLNYCER